MSKLNYRHFNVMSLYLFGMFFVLFFFLEQTMSTVLPLYLSLLHKIRFDVGIYSLKCFFTHERRFHRRFIAVLVSSKYKCKVES